METEYKFWFKAKAYSLDLRGYGEDNTYFEKFNLSNYIQYVKETIKYVKKEDWQDGKASIFNKQ